MEGQLASPPAAGYIPENHDKNMKVTPNRTIFQHAFDTASSYWSSLLVFRKAQSPGSSPKKFFPHISQYLKKPAIFVTKASQESPRKPTFEAVTDAEEPYIHCMMGGSMIGIPYAFKQAGFPIGILLVIIFAFLADYCTLLLIQNSIFAERQTYQGITKEAFGTVISIVISVLQVLFYVTAMATYQVLLGDIFPKIINRILRVSNIDYIRIGRRFPILITALIILLPLCLYRDIRKLSKLSLVSFFCFTMLITFGLMKLTIIAPHVPYTHNPFKFSNMNIFQAIGVISFVFLSQHSSFFLHGSIQESAITRFNKGSYANISYSLLCTLSLGVIGFMTFKGLVQGDFLENYCEEDDVANVIRSFIIVLAVIMYPLDCHGGREIIYNTFLPQKDKTLMTHIAITLALVLVATTVSMLINCLSLLLEISGLLLANPLMIIIPCGSFLRLSSGKNFSIKKLPCLVLASAGLIIALVGIVMVIFMPHRCIHTTRYLPYCNGSSELLGPLITLMSLNETTELDPLYKFNATEFGYENITDMAAAYFT